MVELTELEPEITCETNVDHKGGLKQNYFKNIVYEQIEKVKMCHTTINIYLKWIVDLVFEKLSKHKVLLEIFKLLFITIFDIYIYGILKMVDFVIDSISIITNYIPDNNNENTIEICDKSMEPPHIKEVEPYYCSKNDIMGFEENKMSTEL